MVSRGLRLCAAPLTLALLLAGCGSKSSSHSEKPAKVDPVAHEAELMKITLTPAAEQRLGIAVAPAASTDARSTILTHGEVVVPPQAGGVPITAATDLATLAANQARADGDIARAAAQARATQLNANRAEALVKEQAGSARARDDAQAAAAVARADLAAAQAQRRLFGASVGSLGRQGALWVRVQVIASDIARVDRGATATIKPLGGQGGVSGRPVSGPPSSATGVAAGNVDLYYAVGNFGGLTVGQRVGVELPVAARGSSALGVPASAILHDAYGGEWIYLQTEPHKFERRRVQVASVRGTTAILAAGLKPGDKVVTAGAAELFGTEFGSK